MAFCTRGALAALLLFLSSTLASGADRTMIVLDASGSMWGQIDGRPKLEIARDTLRDVLQSVPGDMKLGLMAYGHREKGSCTDIELIVPPSAGTAQAIMAATDTMRFQGKTPLTAAVRQAAEALNYTGEKSTVVLITDGVESCEANPCALGKKLEETGADFTAHVVGFGLTAEEGREVACLAESTGGKYLRASDSAALKDALAAAVAAPAEPAPAKPTAADAAEAAPEAAEAAPEAAEAETPPAAESPPEAEPAPPVVAEPAPEPEPAPETAKPEFNVIPQVVMAAGGEPLTEARNAWDIFKARPDGSRGEQVSTEYGTQKFSLEPGDYVVEARLGETRVEQKLKVEAGEILEPVFVLDAGTLIVRPRASEGAEISTAAAVEIEYPGGNGPVIRYGETEIILPAGEQKLTVRLGTGEATETVQLAAGQTVEKDVVIGVGQVTVNAFLAAGGEKVADAGLDVRVFKARQNVDGTRDQVDHGFGPEATFDLAPGDHVAVVRLGEAEAEQPFNIRAGEAKDVTAVLNAGILSISAPQAKDIKVLAAKADMQGERRQAGYGFGDSYRVTLPAGDYVVVTDRRDSSPVKETPVSVKAGGHVEITIQ